jgi:hypothetical protein
MGNVTFTLDPNLHDRMKAHPEVKWTEIIRKAISEYLNQIDEPFPKTVGDLRGSMKESTISLLERLEKVPTSSDGAIEMRRKGHELDIDRAKRLAKLEKELD